MWQAPVQGERWFMCQPGLPALLPSTIVVPGTFRVATAKTDKAALR